MGRRSLSGGVAVLAAVVGVVAVASKLVMASQQKRLAAVAAVGSIVAVVANFDWGP